MESSRDELGPIMLQKYIIVNKATHRKKGVAAFVELGSAYAKN